MADIADTFSEINSGSKAGLMNFSSIISSDSSLNVLVPRIHVEIALNVIKASNLVQTKLL